MVHTDAMLNALAYRFLIITSTTSPAGLKVVDECWNSRREAGRIWREIPIAITDGTGPAVVQQNQ